MKNLIVIILLCLPFISTAQPWHFANNGNDITGDGSQGNPYQTITKANTLSGSKYFKSGDTFNGMLVVTSSGTYTERVFIGAYGSGAKPIINSVDSGGIRVINSEYVTVQNLHVKGKGVDTLSKQNRIIADHVRYYPSQDSFWFQNNYHGIEALSTDTVGARFRSIIIENNFVEGYRTGILVQANKNNGRGWQQKWRGFDTVIIRHNEVTLNSVGIYTWAQGVYLNEWLTYYDSIYPTGIFPYISHGTGSRYEYTTVHLNVWVDSNYVHHNYGYNHRDYLLARSGAGIRLNCVGHSRIRGNHATENGHAGSNGVLVEDSTMMRQQPANIELEYATHVVVSHNESSWCRLMPDGRKDGAGFDTDDFYVDSTITEYNYAHNNEGYGWGIGGDPSGIEKNRGNTVRFNKFINNARKGKHATIHFSGSAGAGYKVYNNLIYSNISNAALFWFVNNVDTSFKIFNNTLYCTYQFAYLEATYKPKFFGNNYYGGAVYTYLSGNTTIEQWRATGQEVWDGVYYGTSINPAFNSTATPQLLFDNPVSSLSSFIPGTVVTAALPSSFYSTYNITYPSTDFAGNAFSMDTLRVGDIQGEGDDNSTPAPPTLTADDDANTLSASHALGDTEILVSENNGTYAAYSGTITVGEVARTAGYWKFKIKSATGRNESSVVNSPAFSVPAPPPAPIYIYGYYTF